MAVGMSLRTQVGTPARRVWGRGVLGPSRETRRTWAQGSGFGSRGPGCLPGGKKLSGLGPEGALVLCATALHHLPTPTVWPSPGL